jgi:predicted MFS family arabinose efflux permease
MAATLPLFGTARRFWLLAGLIANAAALLLMAATTSLTLFMLIRLVAGIASGFVMVFGSALVMGRLNDSGRGDLQSVYFMGPGSGIAFSAMLVAGLAGFGVNWSGLWLANGIVASIALGIVAWAIPADSASADTPDIVQTARATPSARLSRPVLLLTLAYGLVGFGYVITSTFIVALVRDTPAIAQSEPYVWLVVGLAALPSAGFWAIWVKRLGAMPAFAIAAVAEAVGVAASVVSPTIPGIMLAAILLGGTFVGLTAMGLVAVRGMMAGDARRGIGLLTAAFGIGQIIGPLFAGYLHDLTGTFAGASYVAAASLLVSAGLALAAGRSRA